MTPGLSALRRLPVLFVAGALAVLAGCGGGGDGGDSPGACSEPVLKQFVLAATREWYLFDDLLPASVNTSSFDSAAGLLDHLTATAREQGKDRYFSYLTTRTAENSLLGEGQYVGFGFRTRTDPVNRPFVIEVYEASPAAAGGLQRGDEIVAVDSGSGYVPVSQLLAGGSTISDALGPASEGVRRGLRLLRDGATHDVALTKQTVTIDPVSNAYGALVMPLPGTAEVVGYLNLRTYIRTADAQLSDAFAQFRDRNIRYYIVDLRYNGGGLVDTSELLNNLLGGARSSSDVQMRFVHNARKAAAEDETRRFSPAPESVAPVRVAFLTTGATASASEININSMTPWIEVAIVGEDTLGKPVGQYAFDLEGCEDRLRLVAFKTVNALGEGDFYDGLAGRVPFFCAAADSVGEPFGSTSEDMTAAALEWLRTGACPVVTSSELARSKAGTAGTAERYPRPRQPSAAQWWLPGIE
jgi:C-terminal processing protease CtpA/Prc